MNRVVCIGIVDHREPSIYWALTFGKIYTIENPNSLPDGKNYLIRNDRQVMYLYDRLNFKPLEEYREEQIDKILR